MSDSTEGEQAGGVLDARESLMKAVHAIQTATMLIRMEQPTIEAFLKECRRDMENFGHIVNPTLYNKSERRAVSAMMEPIFKSAMEFLRAFDDRVAKAQTALDKVKT